jgi:hypothetical protein
MAIQLQIAPELVKMDRKSPNFEFRSFFILFSKKYNPLTHTTFWKIEHSTRFKFIFLNYYQLTFYQFFV